MTAGRLGHSDGGDIGWQLRGMSTVDVGYTQRATAAGARGNLHTSGGAAGAGAALGFAAPLDDGGSDHISPRRCGFFFWCSEVLISLQAQLSVRNIFRRDFRCFRNGLPKTRFSQPGSLSERGIADRAEIFLPGSCSQPSSQNRKQFGGWFYGRFRVS